MPSFRRRASLLQSAGFHKRGSQWFMPNGKQFTMTLTPISTNTDIVTSFNAAAKALDTFGIKSSVDAVQGTEQYTDMGDGNFLIGQHFTAGGTDPLGIFNAELGSGNDFPSLGTYAGKRAMGYGPVENVPGLGKVNVPTTITKESTSVAPGPKMRKLTWDWARLVDQQLPYLTYGTKVYQFTYSTARYKDWPPVNAEHDGPIWNIISNDITGGLLVAVEHGYIRPRG